MTQYLQVSEWLFWFKAIQLYAYDNKIDEVLGRDTEILDTTVIGSRSFPFLSLPLFLLSHINLLSQKKKRKKNCHQGLTTATNVGYTATIGATDVPSTC